MGERLKVDIVTPDRAVLSQEADELYLPGPKGEMGILPEHAPYAGLLTIGEARGRSGSNTFRVAVRGGFVQVRDNQVTLLADEAVLPKEVNRAAREKEQKTVEAKMVDPEVSVEEREALLPEREWLLAKAKIL